MDDSTARSRHPDSIGQAFLWTLLPSLVLFLIAPPVVILAQVSTNITPTQTAPLDLATEVDQAGDTMQITGGTRPNNGTNLFHSFDSFRLGTGDIAHFMNNMQLPTTNIIARVIGGEQSTIDGVLRTNNPLDAADPMNFGAANLWLVNPSGLMLGPNARVEVGGSVSMSTANYLRFDGTSALFDMLSSPASLGQLDVAPVAAFGFVGSNPGDITVQGSQFSVIDGQSISLVGGNVSIESGTAEGGTTQPVQLLAPNGKIQLASAASTGEFDAATLQALPNADSTSFTSFGSVSLAPGSSIDVHGASTVWIKGGQLVLSVNDATLSTSEVPVLPNTISLRSGSSIETSNSGTEPGAYVQLIASKVHLVDGSSIITQTSGPGRGGNIHLTTDNLTLENSSGIVTRNSGHGLVGGDLFLNVGTLKLLGGELGRSQIGSINNTGVDLDEDGVVDVTGVGGNITVQGTQGANSAADSVVLSGGSRITSDASSTSGNGGGLSIRATSLDLGEASIISSSTAGTGHGGDIVVEVQKLRVVEDATISSSTTSENLIPAAGGTVTVQGLTGLGSMASSVLLSGLNTGIVSDSVKGLSGNVTVNAATLNITDGAVISIGSALSGLTGLVTVTADSVLISAGGRISSQSFAEDAGNVTITADELTLDKGSIVTSTTSESLGRGGDVELNVIGTVSLKNGASINSQSGSEEAPFSTGRAGDITMKVGSLTLANHAEITSSSKGTVPDSGDAGNVTITSSGSFTSNASTIATSAENARGGNIDVTAQSVTLSDGTVISASSRSPLLPDGEGNAGNISVRSGSTFVMTNSSMTTEASRASGGQIEIITPEMVRVINGRVSTSVAGSANDTAGGNITIDPQFVVLQGGQIVAKAFAGSGGAINIIATSAFIRDPASIVDASSTLGISGTINIQSPLQNIGGELAPLSDEFSSAAALLAQQCAARAAGGKFSTFVVAAREGLPVEPGGFLASPSLTGESLGSRLSGRDSYPEFSTVTGAFPEYEARPIQLAKLGNACHQ